MVMAVIGLWWLSVAVVILWPIRFVLLTNGSRSRLINTHTPSFGIPVVFSFLPVPFFLCLDAGVIIPYAFHPVRVTVWVMCSCISAMCIFPGLVVALCQAAYLSGEVCRAD